MPRRVSGDFHKECVDLQEIGGEYFSTVEELSEEDDALVRGYLPQGSGTIVRVSKTRNVGAPEHPRHHRRAQEEARRDLLYFTSEDGLKPHLPNVSGDDANVVKAFDPLFVDEIAGDAKLDENDWDGRTVSWLTMPKEIVLGSANGRRVRATVGMTQPPHPPTFQLRLYIACR